MDDGTPEVRIERCGALTIYRDEGFPAESVRAILDTPGEPLKTSRKSTTRRVGEWVVKESCMEGGLAILKHTFARRRYRQAWRAGRHLLRHGVLAPRPVAFIERGLGGLLWGHALISEFLVGCGNVEAHAKSLGEEGASREVIRAFLEGLAQAVHALSAAGAYHSDLSGKNIFTRDGRQFYFIDLDGVVLNRPYTDAMRLKNLVQLYDSFCDLWGPDLLDPFIAHMLPSGHDVSSWAAAVHDGQAKRRARIEAIWRREGKC